jgi:N-acetylmuramoyl-L-alanine amidase
MFYALLAAITIAFPRDGAKLPYVEDCYVIGAVRGGTATNVVVKDVSVPIYKTGAWAGLVPVKEGSNKITVKYGEEEKSVTVVVASKPIVSTNKTNVATNKVASIRSDKLPYASDKPIAHPFGLKPSQITVVLDPGHGGKDTGALSPHAFPEKDANLRVAREVRKALKSKGYKVVMTRDSDMALELYSRPKVSYDHSAKCFVSIHHNAPAYNKDPSKVRYSAVYFWNDIGRQFALPIAEKLAQATGDEVPSKGVINAGLAVTRNPEIPSCLVEVDFITSPQGEEDIWNVDRRRSVGKAIAEGIDLWCKTKNDNLKKDSKKGEKEK